MIRTYQHLQSHLQPTQSTRMSRTLPSVTASPSTQPDGLPLSSVLFMNLLLQCWSSLYMLGKWSLVPPSTLTSLFSCYSPHDLPSPLHSFLSLSPPPHLSLHSLSLNYKLQEGRDSNRVATPQKGHKVSHRIVTARPV